MTNPEQIMNNNDFSDGQVTLEEKNGNKRKKEVYADCSLVFDTGTSDLALSLSPCSLVDVFKF
jgi:hypothetical protein